MTALRKISIFVSVGSAILVSLLYLTEFFTMAEEKVYDTFLRFRRPRTHVDTITFLDVDDQAVAHIGVFPWPRSVVADGLLRLKEYGAEMAIFDIEYIDKSPTQVNEVYLKQGMKADFNRSFEDIGITVDSLFQAAAAGFIQEDNVVQWSQEFQSLVEGERDSLYGKATSVLMDNDDYLAKASALFGRTWATLNVQEEQLSGEQAERRVIAERRFSYPVRAASDARFPQPVDLLTAIPSFVEAAQGAGYTNVLVDPDGIRRRIFLTQKIGEYWYLQLSFSPLMHYLGDPDIELQRNKVIISGIKTPPALSRFIKTDKMEIPLGGEGAMLIDWPPTDYTDSFEHLSFATLSYLDEYETRVEEYLGALSQSPESWFPTFPSQAANMAELLADARNAKSRAVDQTSDEAFSEYLDLRNSAFDRIPSLITAANEDIAYLEEQAVALDDDETKAAVLDETAYNKELVSYLQTVYDDTREVQALLNKQLTGHICILGRVDTGTTDIGANPFYGKYINVGTHAAVLDTIITQSFITPIGIIWSILAALILVPLIVILTTNLQTSPRFIVGFGGAVLILAVSLGLFVFQGIHISVLGPVIAMVIAVVVREALAFLNSEREKLFIRNAFSTYLSGDVVEELVSDPTKLKLGGSKRYITAIFTDVKGFSTISEKLDPEDLVKLLNDYLSQMSDIILSERGTIDKYEGDAIIAFFGAPVEVPDHALRACTAAIRMKRVEAELNKKYAELGMSPSPIFTRIGINTGDMVVGNMGTEKKMNYTMMGNAVNLAARLEGVNKQYGSWILASEDTLRETEGKILYRKLDRVRVVGINTPVRLCHVLDLKDEAPEELLGKIDRFHTALDLFENMDWTGAKAAFSAVLESDPEDAAAKVYLTRCDTYIAKAPSGTWDGVYNLNEK